MFLPESIFSCRLSNDVHTPPCAIACINICVHDKGAEAHVGVDWIMENTETPSMHCSTMANIAILPLFKFIFKHMKNGQMCDVWYHWKEQPIANQPG